MDDRIRISDADRERVTGRLREHFAEGRLTQDELDERVSATLTAKTFGDLRPIVADLPEPVPAAPRGRRPGPARPGWRPRRRGPRVLPLVLLALIAALLIPSASWLAFAFVKLFVVFWLVVCVAGFFLGRARWRMYHHSHHHDDSEHGHGYGRWQGP
jgi:hypothetical protein